MKGKKKLTPKQELFCRLYAKYLNKAQAAREAYPNMQENSAKSIGHKMMTDDSFSYVREYAEKLVKQRLDDLGVNKESILKRIADIAYSELPEVIVSDKGIRITKQTKALANELEFKTSKWGNSIKYKGPDQLKALQMLKDISDEVNGDDDNDEMTIIHIGKK